jgi:hypothetical protein
VTHELQGTIQQGVSVDYQTGNALLTLSINNRQSAFKCYEELKNADKLTIKISRFREKRSNDANKYLWVLCEKLADKLSCDGVSYTKKDIYKRAVKARGIYRQQGNLPLDFAKTMRTAWEKLGTGWVTEQVDFEPDGDSVIVRYYYGTSTYNTKQMHRVIAWLVDECQQLGIETKTPDEIANLISLWGTAKNEKDY